MPFNVWCAGCNHLVGKGVRFNAEKQEIGKYHSTKIWSFVMRAPCCQQRIEVQTDPKNAEYKVVSGGRVKVSNGCALLGWGQLMGPLSVGAKGFVCWRRSGLAVDCSGVSAV